MGFYNDSCRPKRTEWEYCYTGAELKPFADKLYRKHAEQEARARNTMATLLQDPHVAQSDRRMDDLKEAIKMHGTMREQCAVWLLEFGRRPERSFALGLGDVTFFELTQGIE